VKHDHEIKAAFEEAFKPGEAEVDQEAVDAACEAVFAKAAEQFGPEGLYVFGRLNPDMGGVSFRFKRPGIAQRIEHFIPCVLSVPETTQEDDLFSNVSDDTSNDTSLSEERYNEIKEAMSSGDMEFTKSGSPEVSSLNQHIKEGSPKVTADERDAFWDKYNSL